MGRRRPNTLSLFPSSALYPYPYLHRLVFPTPWIASGPPFRTEPATLALDSIATDPPFITARPITSYSSSSVLYRDQNLHEEPFWVTTNFKLCRVLP
jgi:hypothetical protein